MRTLIVVVSVLVCAIAAPAAAQSGYSIKSEYTKGIRYTQQGKYRLAIRIWSNMIRRYPKYIGGYINRCKVRAIIGQYTLALPDCNFAISVMAEAGDVASHLGIRGFLYLKMHRLNLAIIDYDSALRLNARSTVGSPLYRRGIAASSLYGRGVAYRRKGERQKAARDIAAARRIDPNIERKMRRLLSCHLVARCRRR